MVSGIFGRDGKRQAQRVAVGILEGAQAGTGTSASTAGLVGAITLNQPMGTITTDSVTIPAGMAYNLTLTNSYILGANDSIDISVFNGTNTGGLPGIGTITPSVGAATFAIVNSSTTGTSGVVSGTLKLTYWVSNVALSQP